jgi:hypothetical protein
MPRITPPEGMPSPTTRMDPKELRRLTPYPGSLLRASWRRVPSTLKGLAGKGRDVTERIVFWLPLVGTLLSTLGATVPTLHGTLPGAISDTLLLPLLFATCAIAYVLAVREEHDARSWTVGKERDTAAEAVATAHANELTRNASANLGFRTKLKNAMAELATAQARIADLTKPDPLDGAVRLLRTRHSEWLISRKLSFVDLVREFGPFLGDWIETRSLGDALTPRNSDGTVTGQKWLAADCARSTNAANEFCRALHSAGFLEKKTEPVRWHMGTQIPSPTDYYLWSAPGRLLYEHVVNLPPGAPDA